MLFASVAAVLAAATLGVPGDARANGAVLPSATEAAPVHLDVHVAVAVHPYGTTRWARVGATTTQPIMWLVPVRPGARLDLTGDAFLDALDQATKVRVLPPSAERPSSCPRTRGHETHDWGFGLGSPRTPAGGTVLEDEPAARAFIAARGYVVPPSLASRIVSLYQRGLVLVGLELPPNGIRATARTVRVEDDGPAELPLALTGSSSAKTFVTAFVIGPGGAAVSTQEDLHSDLSWADGSDYIQKRFLLLGRTGGWLREAAGHQLLFHGHSSSDISLPSVADAYVPACAPQIRTLAAAAGTVARTCTGGSFGVIPGGTPCVESAGDLPASTFACGTSDDLALALAGTSPRDASVTRLVGFFDGWGVDEEIRFGTDAYVSPVHRAVGYDCRREEPEPSPRSPRPRDDGSSSSTSSSSGGPPPRYEESCSGGTVIVADDYDDRFDEPPYEDPPPRDDSCGGGSSSSSSGWNDPDPDPDGDEGESCSSDSSDGWDERDSESCGGDTSSSDGWDSGDDCSSDASAAVRASRKPRELVAGGTKKPAKRGSSPLSRVTLLAAALILPLRRRLKARAERSAFRA